MNIKPILLAVMLIISFGLFGQEIHKSSRKSQTSFGLGLGLPYGAFGARLASNLANHTALFGGLGYHIAGVGYNFGLLVSIPSESQTEFYLTAMYGTNGAIKVQGLDEYDNVFTGPSFGLGVKVNSNRIEGNYWDFGLLLPITSSEFDEQETLVRNDPRVSGFTAASPVLIVIGYNFSL